MSIEFWQIIDYDVWGNAEDGYDVNNVFPGPTYAFYEKSLATKKGILTALKRKKAIKTVRNVSVVDFDEDLISFEDSKNGKPLFEMRRDLRSRKSTSTGRRR